MSAEKFAFNCCKHCHKAYRLHPEEHCPFDSTMYEWDGVDMSWLLKPLLVDKELTRQLSEAAYIHYTQPLEATVTLLEYHAPKKEEDSDKDPD